MHSRIVLNPAPGEFAEDSATGAIEFHRKLPGYAVTPLVRASAIAVKLGVRAAWIKDESLRLGLPAYKILGASWAAYRALEQRFGALAPWETIEDLARQLRPHRRLELVTASEGNHGRAVARMARWLGLAANILLPASAARARIERIRDEGARVTMIDGTYDEAVKEAAQLDGARSLLISDTAWAGYETVPKWIVEGYSTLFREIEAQLSDAAEPQPDVVAVQMGVGSLGAAVVRHYRRPGSRTRVLGVEPLGAACVLESVKAGRLVDVNGPFDEAMGGLNCGRASLTAWPYLEKGLSACVAISTEQAKQAAGLMAEEGVASSPSGAAGLAGLLAHGEKLGLTPASSVLIVSTEGPAASS